MLVCLFACLLACLFVCVCMRPRGTFVRCACERACAVRVCVRACVVDR
jgi:hypothetical protein